MGCCQSTPKLRYHRGSGFRTNGARHKRPRDSSPSPPKKSKKAKNPDEFAFKFSCKDPNKKALSNLANFMDVSDYKRGLENGKKNSVNSSEARFQSEKAKAFGLPADIVLWIKHSPTGSKAKSRGSKRGMVKKLFETNDVGQIVHHEWIYNAVEELRDNDYNTNLTTYLGKKNVTKKNTDVLLRYLAKRYWPIPTRIAVMKIAIDEKFNIKKFGEILTGTKGKRLVESNGRSKDGSIWTEAGLQFKEGGKRHYKNTLGKILMEKRAELLQQQPDPGTESDGDDDRVCLINNKLDTAQRESSNMSMSGSTTEEEEEEEQ